MSARRIFAAEFIGTAVLMLGGPGSAVLAATGIGGALGVSLAFGFTLLILAYAIGPVSGCHVNPAVTIAMWAAKKIDSTLLLPYLLAQFLGAAFGGLLIYGIAKGQKGFSSSHNFAANGYGRFSPGRFDLSAAVLVEIVFTALLVFVVLSTTKKTFPGAASGLAVGITLALIHLVTIPVDNTSVNPARSFGAAIFSGADALKQLWVFIVFPIVGAFVGLLAWLAVDDARLEDTRLDTHAAEAARDLVT
jgi:aquaporin Z